MAAEPIRWEAPGELPGVRVYTDRDFAVAGPLWRRLLAQDPAATVFQTWEWNSVWWKHYGRLKRPLILVAEGPSGPLALAPLALRLALGGAFRRVEFVGTGVTDYLGFIGPSPTMADCTRAFLGALAARGRWDIIDLHQLNPEQVARCGLDDLGWAADAGWRARLGFQEMCPVLVLPRTWEEMQRRMGRKLRSNAGYYERRLRRDFEMTFDRVPAAESAEGIEEFLSLHAARWRVRHLPGAFYTRRLRQFHRDVAVALAGKGHLALYRLRLNGRLAAGFYGFRYGGRVYDYQGAFDPTLSRYSPGTVLTALVIRDAIDSGCREFDFLRGREPYKRRWPVEQRPNHRLELAREGTPRSLAALRWNDFMRWLEAEATEFLGRVIPHAADWRGG